MARSTSHKKRTYSSDGDQASPQKHRPMRPHSYSCDGLPDLDSDPESELPKSSSMDSVERADVVSDLMNEDLDVMPHKGATILSVNDEIDNTVKPEKKAKGKSLKKKRSRKSHKVPLMGDDQDGGDDSGDGDAGPPSIGIEASVKAHKPKKGKEILPTIVRLPGNDEPEDNNEAVEDLVQKQLRGDIKDNRATDEKQKKCSHKGEPVTRTAEEDVLGTPRERGRPSKETKASVGARVKRERIVQTEDAPRRSTRAAAESAMNKMARQSTNKRRAAVEKPSLATHTSKGKALSRRGRTPSIRNAEYEVEKIVKSRVNNKKGLEYLVKWSGYAMSDNTWEPASNLTHCGRMLSHFHKSGRRGKE